MVETERTERGRGEGENKKEKERDQTCWNFESPEMIRRTDCF